jgi:predicted Zn-dependent peptidase
MVSDLLTKGTATRSAEDIAQAIDSIGGQLDAFTAKEYASYYIKVLDEHLPLAMDILTDIVRNPAFSVEDIEREKKVVVEEIKMVEDTPDDSSTALHAELGDHRLDVDSRQRETVESFAVAAYLEHTRAPDRLRGWKPQRARAKPVERNSIAEPGVTPEKRAAVVPKS